MLVVIGGRMLDNKTGKKISDFIGVKPRTVQEVAHYLNINWRTADRYIERVAHESGAIGIRVFREGSRGALKIVYGISPEKISQTEFQERLMQRILSGKKKEDFSPMDLYQYVEPKQRRAFIEMQKKEYAIGEQDVVSLFKSAQKHILIFSGNMSWANVKQGKTRVLDVLRDIAKTGVPIKVLTRIDIASMKNVYEVLEVNEKLGREAIEIRHAEQPLRAVITDTKQARFKEVKVQANYKQGELRGNMFLFYDVYDPEWIEWLQRVFYVMFRTAVPVDKRLDTLKSIENAEVV